MTDLLGGPDEELFPSAGQHVQALLSEALQLAVAGGLRLRFPPLTIVVGFPFGPHFLASDLTLLVAPAEVGGREHGQQHASRGESNGK
jgi:hypothetical protein